MKRSKSWLFLLLVFIQASCASEGPQPTLKTVTTRLGQTTFEIELAVTSAQRAQGLMFRPAMEELHGMLFVYKELVTPVNGRFWMKNTRLPLSIAFISPAGVIQDLHDMKPFDETDVWPTFPYQYALEVNQGVFQRHGIHVGDRLELDPIYQALKGE